MRFPTFQSKNTHAVLTELTKPTALLNFNSPKIQELILERGWQALPEFERIATPTSKRRGSMPILVFSTHQMTFIESTALTCLA